MHNFIWFTVKTSVRNLRKVTRPESIQTTDVFAETVTIISRNYFQDVHAVMVWLDTILETTRNKVKFAEYDFDKNRKKKMKTRFLIIIGLALMIEGFLATFYTSFVLFPPTEPPMMRPIEGMDYVLFIYRQAFLFSGIIGIFVTLAGIVLWRKRKWTLSIVHNL